MFGIGSQREEDAKRPGKNCPGENESRLLEMPLQLRATIGPIGPNQGRL
jgi:hypothetical protein